MSYCSKYIYKKECNPKPQHPDSCDCYKFKSLDLYKEADCVDSKIEELRKIAQELECRGRNLEKEAEKTWHKYDEVLSEIEKLSISSDEIMRDAYALLFKALECCEKKHHPEPPCHCVQKQNYCNCCNKCDCHHKEHKCNKNCEYFFEG